MAKDGLKPHPLCVVIGNASMCSELLSVPMNLLGPKRASRVLAGFTLIELLVVIAIIAILAALLLP